jgi:hypothetical protein
MYQRGDGVPQDSTEAVKWFGVAAEAGLASAEWSLGLAYVNGNGVSPDSAQGLRWLRKAAEQGDLNAIFSLGVSYMIGRGVPEDPILAHAWFSLGAARGDQDAAKNLDEIARTMSPEQLEAARQSARRLCEEMPRACVH